MRGATGLSPTRGIWGLLEQLGGTLLGIPQESSVGWVMSICSRASLAELCRARAMRWELFAIPCLWGVLPAMPPASPPPTPLGVKYHPLLGPGSSLLFCFLLVHSLASALPRLARSAEKHVGCGKNTFYLRKCPLQQEGNLGAHCGTLLWLHGYMCAGDQYSLVVERENC